MDDIRHFPDYILRHESTVIIDEYVSTPLEIMIFKQLEMFGAAKVQAMSPSMWDSKAREENRILEKLIYRKLSGSNYNISISPFLVYLVCVALLLSPAHAHPLQEVTDPTTGYTCSVCAKKQPSV